MGADETPAKLVKIFEAVLAEVGAEELAGSAPRGALEREVQRMLDRTDGAM